MASSDFTGSAEPRVGQKKSSAKNSSAQLADICTRLEDVRAAVNTAVDSLRAQNVRIDSDVAAALQRRVEQPIAQVIEQLGEFFGRGG